MIRTVTITGATNGLSNKQVVLHTACITLYPNTN
jgi:hypothetical protein